MYKHTQDGNFTSPVPHKLTKLISPHAWWYIMSSLPIQRFIVPNPNNNEQIPQKITKHPEMTPSFQRGHRLYPSAPRHCSLQTGNPHNDEFRTVRTSLCELLWLTWVLAQPRKTNLAMWILKAANRTSLPYISNNETPIAIAEDPGRRGNKGRDWHYLHYSWLDLLPSIRWCWIPSL
jgi:hypothetical protein